MTQFPTHDLIICLSFTSQISLRVAEYGSFSIFVIILYSLHIQCSISIRTFIIDLSTLIRYGQYTKTMNLMSAKPIHHKSNKFKKNRDS